MAGKTYDMNTRISLMGEKEYKQAVSDINRQLTVLKTGLTASQAAFKGNEQSIEALSDKLEHQQAIFAAQAEKVEMMATKLDLAKASGKASSKEIDNLTIQLNRARTEMNRTAAEINQTKGDLDALAAAAAETDAAADAMGDSMRTAAKAMGETGSEAEDAGDKTGRLRTAMEGAGSAAKGALQAGLAAAAASMAALGAAAIAAAKDMTDLGTESIAGNNKLSAMTGATGEELEALGEIANQVWLNNFGENLAEVNDSLATTKTNTGLLGSELKDATQYGYLLKDTFGYDIAESSRTAASLMKQFGIDAHDAYNMIAVGAQNGADRNGDLLDVLNEYAPHFNSLGLGADAMMQALINGAEGGVFSIDKVGDAVKEFNIRAVDGSETTKEAFSALGLNAGNMAESIARGGPAAQTAFSMVVAALQGVKDPLAQNQLAVSLFGTQFEDLGPQVLDVLAGITDATGTSQDALMQINNVRYDDLNNALEGAKRTIQDQLLPTAEAMSGKATEVVNTVTKSLSDGFQAEDIQLIGQSIAAFLMDGIGMLQELIGENNQLFIDTATEAVGLIAETLPTLIETLLPAAMGLLQAVVDALLANTQPLSDMVVNLIGSIATFLIENGPALIKAVGQILLDVTASLGNSLYEFGKPLLDGLVNGITEKAAALRETLLAPFQGIIDWVKDLFGIHSPSTVLSEIGGFLLSGLGEGLLGGLEAVLTTVGDVFGRIWDAIKKIFGFGDSNESKESKQAGMDIMAGMEEGITGNKDELEKAVQKAAQAAVDAFKTAFGIGVKGADDLGTQWMQNIIEGITGSETDMTDAADTAAQATEDALEAILSAKNGKETGKTWASNIGSGIDGQKESLKTKAKGIADAATGALQDAVGRGGSKFNSIGKDIAGGVAAGISNNASLITRAAKNAAKAAYDAAKEELAIASPSRKMMEIGRWFNAGFAEGIDRSMQDVISSAQRLSNIAAGSTVQTRSPAAFELDYDRLGEAVARANREAGIGEAVIDVDGYTFGKKIETHTSRATRERSGKTVKGRTSRMVLA